MAAQVISIYIIVLYDYVLLRCSYYNYSALLKLNSVFIYVCVSGVIFIAHRSSSLLLSDNYYVCYNNNK